MTVSDTHADTIRALTTKVLAGLGDIPHPAHEDSCPFCEAVGALNEFCALIRTVETERDRERARADRAEADAAFWQAALKDHLDEAEAALSAGSGGRETTLDEADLRVEPWGRADHPTMDGVVRNPRGVRITHVPTGLSGECDEEKSQLRNREQALAILRDKIVRAGGRGAA